MIVQALYVFGRGDDGYTSGYAWFTLPNLLRALWRPIRGGGGAICRCVRVGMAEVASGKTSLATRRSSPAIGNVEAVSSSAPDALSPLGGHPPPFGISPAPSSLSPGPADADCSITLGRQLITASVDDKYVAVPLLRLDLSASRTSVLVATQDGLDGNGGRFGRDYGALRDTKYCKDGAPPPPSARSITVTFEPGMRLQFVYVEILDRPIFKCGEHDCAEFSVNLSSFPGGAASTRATDGTLVAIGPVMSTCVRVIKPDVFPPMSGPRGKEDSSQWGSTATDNAARLCRTPSMWRRKWGSTASTPPTSSPPRRRPGGMFHSRSFVARSKGDVLSLDGADLRFRMRLLWSFFGSAFRIQGMKKKVIWHQLTHALLAILDHALYPHMYSYIIYFGVERRRYDVALMVGLTMWITVFVRYRIKLNYFHGSMLVMQVGLTSPDLASPCLTLPHLDLT